MTDGSELLRWLRPQLLWLLLPWLAWAIWRLRHPATTQAVASPPNQVETTPWAAVIDPALLPHLLADVASGAAAPQRAALRRSMTVGRIVLAGLLLLALAGPQLRSGDSVSKPPQRPDAARVLLVDLSPALAALPAADQQRLRVNLRRFVQALPAGETALVAVAGAAWLIVPPTEDVAALDVFLAELAADAAPVPGDRPDQGLALARQTLAATGSRQQDIYWLRIGGPESLPDLQGGVMPKILQVAATVDDWLAVARPDAPARGWKTSLLNFSATSEAGWFDLGPLLILLALPLAALAVLPSGRRAAALLVVGALGGLGLLGSEPATAADAAFAQGVAAYRASRYAEAAVAFAQVAPTDPLAHYNRGNALARSGQLRAALAAYDASLQLRPGDADCLHNRAIVARLLAPPPEQKPPPSGRPPPPPPAPQSAEAARAAEQWLRRPPSGSDGLLKRKLALEESRRQARGGS